LRRGGGGRGKGGETKKGSPRGSDLVYLLLGFEGQPTYLPLLLEKREKGVEEETRTWGSILHVLLPRGEALLNW